MLSKKQTICRDNTCLVQLNLTKLLSKTLLITCCLTIGIFLLVNQSNPVQAQPRITNTPSDVTLPEITATSPPQSANNVAEASPSPTFTPTEPLPNARLISVAASGTALIRDFPEDGAVLGVLQDNTEYQIMGQYFSWYQIQLSTAPNGLAWVYFEDVQINGDLTTIPAVDPNVQPAQLSAQDLQTATAQALFQTPGFAETATAESRIIELSEEESQAQVASTNEFPPTYTPPAEINALQATAIPNLQATPIIDSNIIDSITDSVAEGNIPPLLTILALAVFGTLGMLIASVRR